jgi:hypothetical protein
MVRNGALLAAHAAARRDVRWFVAFVPLGERSEGGWSFGMIPSIAIHFVTVFVFFVGFGSGYWYRGYAQQRM